VALVTVTAPGAAELPDRSTIADWNRTASRRWRLFRQRLGVEMWRRHGSPGPRVVARVAQRQRRGADHLHLVMLARSPDERRRIAQWVELYREHNAAYGFGFVDDPFHLAKGRTRLFEDPGGAGAYVAGNYLRSEQLTRTIEGADRSWAVLWVSPVLMARTGWSLARCRLIRRAWRWEHGRWSQRTWYGRPALPGFFFEPDTLEWLRVVTGWRLQRAGP